MNESNLASYAEALNAERQKLQQFNLIYIGVLIVALIAGYFFFPAGIIIMVALVVFHFAKLNPMKKAFQAKAQGIRLSHCFNSILENTSYEAENGIPTEEIHETGFLPAEDPSEIVVRDTTKGTYHGNQVTLSDVTTNFRSIKGTADDQKKDIVYLCGAWFDITLPCEQETEFLLWNRKVTLVNYSKDRYYKDFTMYNLGNTATDLSEMPEAKEFNEDYVIFLKNDVDPASVSLPVELLKAFEEYTDKVHGTPFLQLKGNHLRIFTRNRFMTVLQFSMKADITEELLKHNDFVEITPLLKIAETLMEKNEIPAEEQIEEQTEDAAEEQI